ncbi:uncharacterized protein [Argopecten irradians]|uniref:uncharacterized protein n=1 Tax=Argopecten irradians TaxID=31199 RepID=UPI00371D21E8
MARTEQTIDGKPEIALVDYNQNITYTIHDGSCSKSASYQPAQSPCIPDDAVLIGTQVLGSSNNSLAINTWRVTTPLLEYKITVTNDTCSFVQETFYGVLSPGVSGSTTFLLSDITEGALPNGIFQVPPECRHAMTGPAVGRR